MNVWLWCLSLGWLSIILGGLATRYQWLPFPVGFLMLPLGGLVCAVAALLAISWALQGGDWGSALAGFAFGVAPLGLAFVLIGQGLRQPAIHDLATTPGLLTFEVVPKLRHEKDNSLAHPSARVIALQRAAYPELQPLVLPGVEATEVYPVAKQLAEELGWQLVGEPGEGVFEAIDHTALLRFTDDIVVRVVDREEGAVVDLRSVSRVGKSDLGANAQRILDFIKRLRPLVLPSQQ